MLPMAPAKALPPIGAADHRVNNLNLLRMLAASAVIVSHSYPISLGPGTIEPLEPILQYSLGAVAVKVFFAISGFLIMMSFERRRSLLDFAVARFLRLIPALVVVAVITAFLIGPLFTSLGLPAYFSHWRTLIYVPQTASMLTGPAGLPGVFTGTPYPGINGPLWTLHYELACYIFLAVAGLLGFFRGRRFIFLIILYACFYALMRLVFPAHEAYAFLSLPFVVGMALYRYRDIIRLRWQIFLLLVAVAALLGLANFAAFEASTIALSYGTLWFGFLRVPALLSYNRLGDYSYGVYIYGWPMQQMTITLLPGATPLQVMAIAFPAALACAILSWTFVERPALQMKRPLADALAARLGSRRSGTGTDRPEDGAVAAEKSAG